MKRNLIEVQGHYYYTSLPDLADLAGAAVSFLTTLAVMLLVWQAVALLLRQPRQRRWRLFCTLVIVCGSGYTALYMLDVPSVLAVITSPGSDVPIVSTIKTAFIAGLLLTLSRVLSGATRPLGGVRETR